MSMCNKNFLFKRNRSRDTVNNLIISKKQKYVSCQEWDSNPRLQE